MLKLTAASRAPRALVGRALLAPIAVLAVSVPADARTAHDMRLGNAFEFQLEGNPSTGYKWVLNKTTSTGLESVEVEPLGYGPSEGKAGMVGTPAPFKFRITCIKTGSANLFFDYIGPTGKRSRESHETWVRCE